MRERGAVWTFLLTVFVAVAAAVAILPACGDDDGRGYQTDYSQPLE